MLHALSSLVFLLAPQDPAVGEVIGALHAEHGVAKAADGVTSRLTALPEPRIRGVAAPYGVVRLRAAGVGAVDVAREIVPVEGADDPVRELIELVAPQWSKRVPRLPSKRIDLDGFEDLCEHVHRDLRGALGSGRDLDTTASRLLSMIDRVRVRGIVKGQDKPTRELIEERFERVSRVDRDEILTLARRLVAAALDLDDPRALERLRRQETGQPRHAVKGGVLQDREAGFGRYVIGGFDDNEYDCTQVDVIVDLGGNDTYRGPAGGASEQRRLAVVVDLGGNDVYQALNDGLGSGTFGIGLLVDVAGNDVYRGGDRCAGFGAAGVGIALDLAGDDRVDIGELGLGVGLAGIGVFADFAGNDVQQAKVESFGCGLPAGLGVFVDAAGDDRRSLDSEMLAQNGRSDATSTGFGVGFGDLPELAGGLGVCVDLAGKDTYTAAALAFGVGGRGGCGVFRDAGGHDVYRAGPASCGASFASGIGIALEVAGDDRYVLGEIALGAAVGGGAAWFVDVEGNDSYEAGAASFGAALRAAMSGFLDLAGNDAYSRSGADLKWPVGDDARGDAVSLFLDDGGEIAQFEALGIDMTEPAQRLEVKWPEGLELRVVVRR